MTISLKPTASASRQEFEYELLDTGVFDQDRYFDVFVEYAKETPEDILIQITAWNRGPKPRPCISCPRCGSATPGTGTRYTEKPGLCQSESQAKGFR